MTTKIKLATDISDAGTDGWVVESQTWTYSSADAPTFIASVNADMTSVLSPGMRVKLTQTTDKYFIVTAVGAFSGGATLITLYGGTDYTLANAAITSPKYSSMTAPQGFPLDPAKWTVSFIDTTPRTQASPTISQFYNINSDKIDLPIGVWNVSVQTVASWVKSADGVFNMTVALSTSNNSISNAEWSWNDVETNAAYTHVKNVDRNLRLLGTISAVSKTPHYLLLMTNQSVVSIGVSSVYIRAVCAYLGGISSPVNPMDTSWIPETVPWTYSSADAPTFVASVSGDATGRLSPGMRVRLNQTTNKYFLVTAVGAFSGGATLVTLYGGTDYVLANAAISNPCYSSLTAPQGFPLDPNKWSVEVTNNTNAAQASPTTSTWYNLGGISVSLPIGVWDVEYFVNARCVHTGQTYSDIKVTLSSANNTESDADLTTWQYVEHANGFILVAPASKRKTLALAAKTSYYLNGATFNGATSIAFRGDYGKTIVRAVCAYL